MQSQWQPIETAPEMTFILIYENGKYHIAQYELTDLDGYFDVKLPFWGFVDGWLDADTEFSPTHWMPLPEPPK